MRKFGVPFYKRVPILRLLLALIVGILLQQYFQLNIIISIFICFVGVLAWLLFSFLPTAKKFAWAWMNGCAITLLFVAIGSLVVFTKNTANAPKFIGNYYTNQSLLQVTLQEPLVAKAKSYKALAKAEILYTNRKQQPVLGNILLYFKKDSLPPNLGYGSQLIIAKTLQPISNSGNPNSFNYQQYCSFQGIYYQCFLSPSDYKILPTQSIFWLDDWMLKARNNVLSILRNNIADSDSQGIAEALLIGYRNDLDKDLVQAYSNTGVVHIIAISGLHIAMIYGLLLALFRPFKQYRLVKLLQPIVIVLVLWGFTLIAGAAPSILRSAVMFSFVVIGDSWGKKTNIYNSLAASAMVILIANPFSWWDVGFQLSYAAVLSIVLFSKPIENWLYFNNKLLQYVWQMCAVTLAAQILTLPIILYYFHQFPTLFLFTNLLIVPLSGCILFAELLLLIVAFIPPLAQWVGAVNNWLIVVMNDYVQHTNGLSFALINSIQVSMAQTILLYIGIAALAIWLFKKQSKAFLIALGALAIFFGYRSWDIWLKQQQQQLVVYNVPQHTAIDLLDGLQYHCIADAALLANKSLQNFHLQPNRVAHRVQSVANLPHIRCRNQIITSHNKKIAIIHSPIFPEKITQKINVDVVIIAQNPKLYISQLAAVFNCPQYVFDGSNPAWKISKWKKDCENLHLRHYSTQEQGAFVLNL